jgi:hypothetical protein
MALKIGLAVAGIILIFLGYIGFQSEDYTISRELKLNASAEKIFPWINNSKKTYEWMPWQLEDPKVQMNFEGPEEGLGAVSMWTSEGKMGVGRAVVTEMVPNQLVKTKLEYAQPMKMVQDAVISLTSAEGGTVVKWSVTGKNNFVGRLFCFFINMDKLVGTSFETGLNNLKSKVESQN